MARGFLKGIKAENRIEKIRLIEKNDPVVGGQPSDNEDEFTSNTPMLDLACTIKHTQQATERLPLGKQDQFPVGLANGNYQLLTVAQTRQKLGLGTAATANVLDTFGDSKTDAGSQRTINEAYKLAKGKQDPLTFIGAGPEVMKVGALGLGGKVAVELPNDVNLETYDWKNGYYFARGTIYGYPSADGVGRAVTMVINAIVYDAVKGKETLLIATAYGGVFYRKKGQSNWEPWEQIFTSSSVLQTIGTDVKKTMSQKSITDLVTAKYRDVTNQRSFNIKYTNTQNKAILVTSTMYGLVSMGQSGVFTLLVNDGKSTINEQGIHNLNDASGLSLRVTLTAFVQPGETYEFKVQHIVSVIWVKTTEYY